MAEQNVVRESALQGHMHSGQYGIAGAGVVIGEVRDLTLWQLAAWPDTIESVAAKAAQDIGLAAPPGFSQATGDSKKAMLRIEPLKYWLFGVEASSESSEQSVVLDLSHSRTHLRLSGDDASSVLNSFLPLDLREQSFPVNWVASSAMHHVGVTLWRSEKGYELFVPRGFAVSIWELLYETSLQYGLLVE